MKLTEAEQKRLAWFIAERQSDQGMPSTTLPEFIDLLLAERDEQKLSLATLRDEVLHDPDHDNDTINWALGVIDAHSPDSDHRVMLYEE